jgi:hypothetical protein
MDKALSFRPIVDFLFVIPTLSEAEGEESALGFSITQLPN